MEKRRSGWKRELVQAHGLMAGLFARSELRARSLGYVQGLLSGSVAVQRAGLQSVLHIVSIDIVFAIHQNLALGYFLEPSVFRFFCECVGGATSGGSKNSPLEDWNMSLELITYSWPTAGLLVLDL
jgi:hypothetical protein